MQSTRFLRHILQNAIYPLTCFATRITPQEKLTYKNTARELQQLQHYSLLDHLHPHTGESEGQIVKGQNCTVVYKLFQALLAGKIDFEALLGDNPTPQCVKELVGKLYFEFEKAEIRQTSELIELTDDELRMSFHRDLGNSLIKPGMR